ncbi:hypothetical protein EHQ52_16700 [Leptospira koniambonensis]|uniref:Uncharacterized protein n=1 Tax=Leptospira koniambonensis TaxID=2484950 RepID=A0A4R9J5Y2_9LEPT|nr:hypothetical protein EHQ52_16700 [Leptospira koniambonensis]
MGANDQALKEPPSLSTSINTEGRYRASTFQKISLGAVNRENISEARKIIIEVQSQTTWESWPMPHPR